MRKIIFIIFMLLPLTALGQNVIEDDYHVEFDLFKKGEEPLMIDVEGIHIGEWVDSAKVVSIFGKPDRYHAYDTEFGISQVFQYGGSWLHFEANGCLINFRLSDNKYAALIDTIEGGIRVGDPISKLDNYVTGKPVLIGVDDTGNDIYAINKDLCDITRFCVQNGIITYILFLAIP